MSIWRVLGDECQGNSKDCGEEVQNGKGYEGNSGNNDELSGEYRNVKFNTGISDSFFESNLLRVQKYWNKRLRRLRSSLLKRHKNRLTSLIITPEYAAGYKFDYAYVFKWGYRGNSFTTPKTTKN